MHQSIANEQTAAEAPDGKTEYISMAILRPHQPLLQCALLCLAFCLLSIPSSDAFGLASFGSHQSTCCSHTLCSKSNTSLKARRRRDEDFDDEDDYEDFEDEDDFYDNNRSPRRRRQPIDDLGEYETGRQDRGMNVPSSFGRRQGWRLPESVSKALLAGIFVLGVGLGVTVDSAINTNPRDLASRDAIDQAAPNPNLCAKFGASAMAFDQSKFLVCRLFFVLRIVNPAILTNLRISLLSGVFVSFNPFNVYVAQADVKPACVLRDANVVPVLRDSKLINDDEVRSCKRNMNTWAFVGDLADRPQLSCVYRSADAQNEFLSDPKRGIGEDYLDDDDQKISRAKDVKNALSQGQKDAMKQAMDAKTVLEQTAKQQSK